MRRRNHLWEILNWVKNYGEVDMDSLSENLNTSVNNFLEHPELKWNFSDLQSNPDFLQFFLKNRENWDFDTSESFSANPAITIEIIRANSDYNWDYNMLSRNPNLSFGFILENLDKDWDFFAISKNDYIDLIIVENYPDFPWDWRALSLNPNFTYEIIISTLNEDNCWFSNLAGNKSTPWSVIRDNPNHHWNNLGRNIIYNPNITLEDIKNNKDFHLDYFLISRENNFTINEVINNPEIPWDFEGLVQNPCFSWKDIKKHPKLWMFRDDFIHNPNLTLKSFKELVTISHNVNSEYTCNRFLYDEKAYERSLRKKYFKKWRSNLNIEKEYRYQWRNIYSSSIDILNCRQRDKSLGITTKKI